MGDNHFEVRASSPPLVPFSFGFQRVSGSDPGVCHVCGSGWRRSGSHAGTKFGPLLPLVIDSVGNDDAQDPEGFRRKLLRPQALRGKEPGPKI